MDDQEIRAQAIRAAAEAFAPRYNGAESYIEVAKKFEEYIRNGYGHSSQN